jgi:hypothetical protein
VKRYEVQEVTVRREVLVEHCCDGCGIAVDDTEFGSFFLVEIGVNVGEEWGRLDEYEYCDPCLAERAPALRAAGSRSELVGGTAPEEVPDGR